MILRSSKAVGMDWRTAQYIDSLLQTCRLDQKEQDKINSMLDSNTMSEEQAEEVIQYLKDNQLDSLDDEFNRMFK